MKTLAIVHGANEHQPAVVHLVVEKLECICAAIRHIDYRAASRCRTRLLYAPDPKPAFAIRTLLGLLARLVLFWCGPQRQHLTHQADTFFRVRIDRQTIVAEKAAVI